MMAIEEKLMLSISFFSYAKERVVIWTIKFHLSEYKRNAIQLSYDATSENYVRIIVNGKQLLTYFTCVYLIFSSVSSSVTSVSQLKHFV